MKFRDIKDKRVLIYERGNTKPIEAVFYDGEYNPKTKKLQRLFYRSPENPWGKIDVSSIEKVEIIETKKIDPTSIQGSLDKLDNPFDIIDLL